MCVWETNGTNEHSLQVVGAGATQSMNVPNGCTRVKHEADLHHSSISFHERGNVAAHVRGRQTLHIDALLHAKLCG